VHQMEKDQLRQKMIQMNKLSVMLRLAVSYNITSN
jgi:hypothetical protein